MADMLTCRSVLHYSLCTIRAAALPGAVHDINTGRGCESASAPRGHQGDETLVRHRGGGGWQGVQGVRPQHLPADDWQSRPAAV